MWLVQNVLLDESFKRKFNGIIIILSKAYRLISAKQTSRVGLPKNIFELLTNFKSWECFTDTIQPLKNGPKQNPFFSSKSTLQTTTTSTAKWSDSLPIILKLFFSNKKSIVFNSILIHLVFIIVLTLACCFAATWTTTTKTTTIATTTTMWLWTSRFPLEAFLFISFRTFLPLFWLRPSVCKSVCLFASNYWYCCLH